MSGWLFTARALVKTETDSARFCIPPIRRLVCPDLQAYGKARAPSARTLLEAVVVHSNELPPSR